MLFRIQSSGSLLVLGGRRCALFCGHPTRGVGGEQERLAIVRDLRMYPPLRLVANKETLWRPNYS